MTEKKKSLQPVDALALAAGNRIRQLREEQELALHELAKLAYMDANYLWRIEAGRQNLSLRNVARLAKALGLTLSELFDGVAVPEIELASRAYVKRDSKLSA